MRIVKITIWIVAFACLLSRQAVCAERQLDPVTGFDLNRYLGKWYEIARMPMPFEKQRLNVTTNYSLKKDGAIHIVSTGFAKKNDKLSVAIGKARLAASPGVGYLKVSFWGPFYSDYIIVALDLQDYRYAMVASPDEYLWIYAREPRLDQETLSQLIAKARQLGYDTSRLYYVPHDL
jgi:apolipoprotein D and lipocalin family protein